MKICSWSNPHTFHSALRMLSADHLNIDGPPVPVKCVKKFRSALGGEVTHRCACVCVCVIYGFVKAGSHYAILLHS